MKGNHMASVNKQDIPMIAEFMTDIWTYIKGHWKDDGDPEYWNHVIDDCEAITEKYKSMARMANNESAAEQLRFIYYVTVSVCNGMEKKSNVKNRPV